MKPTRSLLLTALLGVFVAGPAAAQIATEPALTLGAARDMAAAAEAHATANAWNVVIAIVDDGGHLVYLQRMDGTQIGSVDIAIQKARTAALFRRPTRVFAERVAAGAVSMLAVPNVIALEGGLPIEHDGHLIGGIGVSGVTAEQDGMIAAAGIAGLRPAR